MGVRSWKWKGSRSREGGCLLAPRKGGPYTSGVGRCSRGGGGGSLGAPGRGARPAGGGGGGGGDLGPSEGAVVDVASPSSPGAGG